MLHHYPDPGVDCRWRDSRRWWQALYAPELRVVISCDEVEVFQFARPWLPGAPRQLLGQQQHALPGQAHDELPPDALWQTLREVFAPLAGQAWHVVIVLSNQYVRWLTLPWQADIHSQADRAAYYQHGVQQDFGSAVQDWQISACVSAYGQHTLVSALPPGLADKLYGLCAEYALPPGIIAPAWMLTANQTLHWQKQGKLAASGWVVCRESTCLTVACLVEGDWQQIWQLPVYDQWRHTLHQLLLREQVMHPDRAALPVFLAQAQLSGASGQALAPFHVVDVQASHWLGEAFHQSLRRRMA